MKKIVALLLLISSQVVGQHSISWEDEVPVSDGSIYGVLRPRMALNAAGHPVLVYGNYDGEIFVSRYNGVDFDPPISILPSGIGGYISYWTGPDIASKGDTIIVVFKATPVDQKNVYTVRSTDGGISFSDTIRVDAHIGNAWMPSLDMTSDGNPIITYMVHDGMWTNPRYVIARSLDAGLTYLPENEVTSGIPGEACDCCPAEVVVDGSKQMLLFRNNDNNIRDIYGVYSNDDGSTFPYQSNVDNLNWNINACMSTGPHGVFTGNNEFISVYANAITGQYRAYLTKSNINGGVSFLSRDTISKQASNSFGQNYPRIHGKNDTIVMAWQERFGTDWQIFTSVSTNQLNDHIAELKSFSSQSNASQTGVQENPDVVYDKGYIHLCFSDVNGDRVIYRRGEIDVLGIESMYNSISVSPNPSNGNVTIHHPNIIAMNLFDAQGREVEFDSANSEGMVKMSFKPSVKGIYHLHIQTEHDIRTVIKLVIE